MKRFGVVILWIFGLYFVVRAIAEPFVIDLNDPATYHNDWGGPSLTGVLLVHCGLGLLAAALMGWRLMRRSSVRLRRGTGRRSATPRIPGEPGSSKEPGPRAAPAPDTRRVSAEPAAARGRPPRPSPRPRVTSGRAS